MKLSERLKTIASMVTPGYEVTDVGTDHAYVPIYLVSEGLCPRAVASDIGRGPLERAAENIRSEGLSDRIDTVLADGVPPGEPQGTLIIAGMGGILMSRILENAKDRLSGIKEIIGEPQSDLDLYRKKLAELGFVIAEEAFLKEDGKYYTVIKAVPGDTGGIYLTEAELLYGPLLLGRRDPLLMEYLREQRAVCEEILSRMNEAGLAPDHPRRAEITAKIALIGSALQEC